MAKDDTILRFENVSHEFGPYLRAIPVLPVGAANGAIGIAAAAGAGVGWVYDETIGDIHAATTTETDAAGVLYSTY